MAIGTTPLGKISPYEMAKKALTKKELTPQEKCEAKGWFWDVVNNVCIDPEKQKQEQEVEKKEMPKVEPSTPEVYTAKKGGELSGIELDGQTYLGLSPEDVQQMAGRKIEKTTIPEGAELVGTAQAQAEERRRKILLAGQVGQIDFELASQLEAQGISVKEAIAAGMQGINPVSVGAGIVTGAAAGSAGAIPTAGLSIPATAAIGGGVTLAAGFYSDVQSNIKSQRKDLVTAKTKELKQRKTSIQNYISAANANPANADEYLAAMKIEKSLIRRDYNTLIQKGDENLKFWGDDATTQIAEYDVFFESVEPSLDLRMEQAILKPDPSRAYLSIGDEE